MFEKLDKKKNEYLLKIVFHSGILLWLHNRTSLALIFKLFDY